MCNYCNGHPLSTMSCNFCRTSREGQSANARVRRSSRVRVSKFVRTLKRTSFLIRALFPQKYTVKRGICVHPQVQLVNPSNKFGVSPVVVTGALVLLFRGYHHRTLLGNNSVIFKLALKTLFSNNYRKTHTLYMMRIRNGNNSAMHQSAIKEKIHSSRITHVV